MCFSFLSKSRKKEVVEMDMREFAKIVTLKEGKKESVSIAQVMEILKIAFTQLGKMTDQDVIRIINRYRR